MELLSLNFSEFASGDTTTKAQFSRKLVQQLETYGFATVYNHGVDEGLLKEAFEWVCFRKVNTGRTPHLLTSHTEPPLL